MKKLSAFVLILLSLWTYEFLVGQPIYHGVLLTLDDLVNAQILMALSITLLVAAGLVAIVANVRAKRKAKALAGEVITKLTNVG